MTADGIGPAIGLALPGSRLPDVAGPAGDAVADDRQVAAERELSEVRQAIRDDSRAAAVQHPRGKLTARERVGRLLDAGSFVELQAMQRHSAHGFGVEHRRPHTDGVVTGWGRVDGREVFVFAHDFSIFGGALGATFAAKIHHVMDLALQNRRPIIGLNDGAGARIQEGADALDGYGGIFRRNVAASGVIPQISVIAGTCAGGAVYSPTLTDFVFMVDEIANMYVTGPDVVRAVTGEAVSHDELGGSGIHSRRTGVASFTAKDEDSCLAAVRELLGFLPSHSEDAPPRRLTGDAPDRATPALAQIVPGNPRKTYDVKRVIREIVDNGHFMEVSAGWARNVVCALGRLDGYVAGVVANQPQSIGGVLNIAAAEKAARFVRTCDAFGIPLLTLVDVPGFLPGTRQEHDGLIRRGAKLIYAYCEATVPRVQLIMRKAYGGAYIVMDSKSVGTDLSFAWPGNEVAVMGADAAVDLIYRKQLAQADGDAARLRAEFVADYRNRLMHPHRPAEGGHVDDIITAAETRATLIASFAMLRSKTRPAGLGRRHGNIPL
jgi:acetyl-CoA carboxylase carboxyltransferase component